MQGTKKEVARYAQKGGHEKDGVLVLDAREVGKLVCVLTVCACMEVRDSFSKRGKGWGVVDVDLMRKERRKAG
jgi:hypothetical protein